jgi:1,2-diacylglycerol 3-beta-galactosyltransferase
MKRILIFMSDTGGGHRASAEALEAAFAERYCAEFQVDSVDLWMKHAPWPLNELPRSYRFLVDDVPHVYEFLWDWGKNPEAMAWVMGLIARWADRQVTRVLDVTRPDLVAAVHPLLQHVPLIIMNRKGISIPFVTILTELATFHPLWFNRKVTRCFVPNDKAYGKALQAGLTPAQVRQCGLPINPVFGREPRPRCELRRELGMREDMPAALLTSGGEGMGPVHEIAQAVASGLAATDDDTGAPAGQLIVICGRNQHLQAELQAVTWPIPTIIRGFVTNMADWMAASDLIITKAGSLTIAEAMARGLPIVLDGYIPGQEAGNISYVVDKQVGAYSADPQEIAAMVGRWFGPERQALADMSRRARELSHPCAAYEIADEIAELLRPAVQAPAGDASSRPLQASLTRMPS